MSVVAGVGGVLLALPSGGATVALAVVLLGLGYAYDLWFKGTAWSWVPFALAIPLFPTYGWLGAVGSLPAVWAVLLPVAMVAGAALALGNAAVDVERDEATGVSSVATALGWRRAAVAALILTVCVAAVAAASLVVLGAPVALLLAVVLGGGVAVAGTLAILDARPDRREVGWKVQAVGVALVGAGWLAAVAAAGLTGSGG
jgi:4-hydroxybenzoate polyprenyltransferase